MPDSRLSDTSRRRALVFGIVANLGVLGFFKYTHFLVENIEWALGTRFHLMEIVLPLAISFFTFQQIAYLVDSYRGTTRETELVNYFLFVTFFPQLIAGPIVHHAEVLPQFEDETRKTLSWDNIARGLHVFAIGLFKKVVLADSLSLFVRLGFDTNVPLSVFEAWVVTFSYTFQLYFDFSGYTDMGLGAARMFNIELPKNFRSPYQSRNIQEFWRRWHITLSRWLTSYLYIPLGGSRQGLTRTLRNLIITFLLGGLWHGAGWTFIVWGACHGIATVVHRLFSLTRKQLPWILAWFFTFLFVHIAWIFFRAVTLQSAFLKIKALFGFAPLFAMNIFDRVHIFDFSLYMSLLGLSFVIVLAFPNSQELSKRLQLTHVEVAKLVFLLTISFLFMNTTTPKEFLYFDF